METARHWSFERVEASHIHTIRTRVLRPNYPEGMLCIYPQDELEGVEHWAANDTTGRARACITFMSNPSPHALEEPGVQLRGMAVDDGLRGHGLGARLLDAALTGVALSFSPARIVWCNARVGALSFYDRAGFEQWGELFFIPEAGDHYVMWRHLPTLIS